MSIFQHSAYTPPSHNYQINKYPTLYYTTLTFEVLNFIPYTKSGYFSGITVGHMTNNKYILDITKLITFVGYRIVPTNPISQITVPQYNETITIKTSDGNIEASTTYSDSGTGFATTLPSVVYYVLNAFGKYAGAKTLTIYFDNIHSTRVVEIS